MPTALRRFSALVLAILLSAPSLRAQSAAPPDFASLRKAWVQKLESRDLAGAMALYSLDATFFNNDGTHVSGDALRDLFQSVFRSFHARITMTPRTHGFSGFLAYESGSYVEDITASDNGRRTHLEGDYLTIYRRIGAGPWLIVEQMWSEAPHK
jgi:ketosteroid isomerase-like protein